MAGAWPVGLEPGPAAAAAAVAALAVNCLAVQLMLLMSLVTALLDVMNRVRIDSNTKGHRGWWLKSRLD